MGPRIGIGIRGRWTLALLGCAAGMTALVVSRAEPAAALAAAGRQNPRGAESTLAGQRRAIDTAIRKAIVAHDLHAVIVQVTVDGRPLITKAYGTSMTGVPATVQMHFRNGAVAIPYMTTLLLRLVDEKKVRLSDPISKWLPGLRDARRVTLRMLAAGTAGYPDYATDPRLADELNADPFRETTTQEQLALTLSKPQLFTPGTNWSYSHSDYVILGLALAKITRRPLDVALRNAVLRPLGLRNTSNSATASIPPPVLHAYTSDRRQFLGIKPSIPFLEDSTYWNPSASLARGAVETTDIGDLTRTAIGIGAGRLLTRRSHAQQIDANIGFGHSQPDCPVCRRLNRVYGYGLGVVRNGSWILQNPGFGGYSAVEAYLPAKRISIAIATTYGAGSFDAAGNGSNWASPLYSQIGAILAPSDPPPTA
jgi:CubicO group peptidase (beta-lactamase class C family)